VSRFPPRDAVAASLPDPGFLGDAMHGLGKDGKVREVYLYHVVDNEDTMREYGAQSVVW
jgi:saccharopine dehydrogenase (NAD+, L-lysine forming)